MTSSRLAIAFMLFFCFWRKNSALLAAEILIVFEVVRSSVIESLAAYKLCDII